MISVSAVPAAADAAEKAYESGSTRRFLQSRFWTSFKASQGWDPSYFLVSWNTENTSGSFVLTVLLRRFSRFASVAYVPMGPEVPGQFSYGQMAVFISSTGRALRPFLPGNTLYIRFDPPYEKNADGNMPAAEYGKCLREAGLCKPSSDIQPPDTVVIDLSVSEQEILDGMKPKWRYNIRLAGKKGVSVRRADSSETDIFYRLYQETAARDGIAIHGAGYYRELLERSEKDKKDGERRGCADVRLYIAEHEGEPIAAIITLFNGHEGAYLYGASSDRKRNVMPAYILQWTAVCDAKQAGCAYYDLYGIPPSDDESHPMHGLYRFKTGFGGRVIHRVGSVDMPLRPFLYRVYTVLENGRAFWFKRVRKLFRGGGKSGSRSA